MIEVKSKIVNEDNVKPFKSQQQKRQRFIAVFVVLIVAALVVGAYFLLVPREEIYNLKDYQSTFVERGNLIQTTQGSGAVIIPVQFNLLSSEAGYALNLYVQEGDSVVQGQLLARIDVPDLLDDLYDSEANLENSIRNLERSRESNAITLARKERELKSLAKDIEEAEEDLKEISRLVEIGAGKKSDLEQAEDSLENLIDNKIEKELQFEEDKRLQDLDMEIKLADITSTETKIERLEVRIASADILSPMDGDITVIEDKLAVPGSKINANLALFTIVDPTSAIIELDVSEQYAALLQEEQQVELTISNSKSYGIVESIGKVAELSSDGLGATVVVKVRPSPDSGELLQGASVVGVFELGYTEGALLLPRGPYLTTGSQRYLYKIDGDSAQRIDVTFGNVQGNNIEVLRGVEEGDEIITSGYQNFIEYKTIKLAKGE